MESKETCLFFKLIPWEHLGKRTQKLKWSGRPRRLQDCLILPSFPVRILINNMAEEIIGLDIGTSSLKAVAVKATSKSFAVRNISIATNPIGRVLSDSPAEQDKLVAQI